MQIIGHCHLRVGSELEPALGGTLYTALVTALAEIEPPSSSEYIMSGVYGFRIPDNEGIGFFTIQNKNFRIFFLCEGLFGRGIPYLAGTLISRRIRELFTWLETEISESDCQIAHVSDKDDSFWFDAIVSLGFGRNIPIEQYERIYPLRYIEISAARTDKQVIVNNLETSEIAPPPSFGFDHIGDVIATKIQGIFSKPHFSFLVYEALFHQISEFVIDFQPNTIILTYSSLNQKGDLLENTSAIVSFLSITPNNLTIRYCLPMDRDLELEESQTVHAFLRSIFLTTLV
jgi:hypothetical protein